MEVREARAAEATNMMPDGSPSRHRDNSAVALIDLRIRAWEAIKAGDFEMAGFYAEQILTVDRSNLDALLIYGGALIQESPSRDYKSALTIFDRAIDVSPDSEQASIGRFHCLLALGRKWDAINEVKRFKTFGRLGRYATFLSREELDDVDF